MRELLAHVDRNDSLFVFPYQPIHYFLTQARNPTTFSYLAPGMMKEAEETAALEQLRSRPPDWILYLPLTDAEFARVFPNTEGLDWRFHRLEAWIAEHYRPLERPEVNIGGYQLMQRIGQREETGKVQPVGLARAAPEQ